MNDFSILAYKNNLVYKEHNKVLGASEKNIEKWLNNGQLSDIEKGIILSLGYLLFANIGQIETFIAHKDMIFSKKSLKKLCDYGIVHAFCFQTDNEDYRTCKIYGLTQSGYNLFKNMYPDEIKGVNHRPIFNIKLKTDYIDVLNRVAFNGFYTNCLKREQKCFLSYMVGNICVEGRYQIYSELYSKNQLNLFVLPVRNTDDNFWSCALKIRAIQEHCYSKKMKAPWFIIIAENHTHEKQLYLYLSESDVVNKSFICTTYDEYLSENDVDPFDNIGTFEKKGDGIISSYKKLVL